MPTRSPVPPPNLSQAGDARRALGVFSVREVPKFCAPAGGISWVLVVECKIQGLACRGVGLDLLLITEGGKA